MRSNLRGLGIAALIAACATSGATAGERFGHGFHRHGHVGGYGYGYGGYGFGDAAIGGAYVGAPLTRFPRPSEIVPPAWGYGTFGVPTVTGIRQAPTAAPTLTVINTTPAPRRRGSGPRILSRGGDGQWTNDGWASDATPGDGVRVISVTVPRR